MGQWGGRGRSRAPIDQAGEAPTLSVRSGGLLRHVQLRQQDVEHPDRGPTGDAAPATGDADAPARVPPGAGSRHGS